MQRNEQLSNMKSDTSEKQARVNESMADMADMAASSGEDSGNAASENTHRKYADDFPAERFGVVIIGWNK